MEDDFHVPLSSNEALFRIENAKRISLNDKNNYSAFITNFPNLEFYYNKRFCLDELELDLNIEFPNFLREYRFLLASVQYGFSVEFKFDSFIRWSPREDRLDQLWYSIGLLGMPNEGDTRDLFLNTSQDYKFIPIASVSGLNADSNYLAVNSVESDFKIYEFDVQDLYDHKFDNEPIEQSAFGVFESYPQMLAHISEIKYLDGKKEIIVKARDI